MSSTEEGMPTIKLGENWKQDVYIAAVRALKQSLKVGDPFAIDKAYGVVADMEDRLWHLSDKRRLMREFQK